MADVWHQIPGFLRSPNISGDWRLYEVENRAADPEGAIECAMERIAPWRGRRPCGRSSRREAPSPRVGADRSPRVEPCRSWQWAWSYVLSGQAAMTPDRRAAGWAPITARPV